MTDIQNIPVQTIDGTTTSLEQFAGSAVLVVNVASKCGLTPQYEALEALYERFKDDGLVVAGFPSNDFAGQEPGTDEEIAEFCSVNYGVSFPLFSKISVVGENEHPLYAALTAAAPTAEGDKAGFRENLRGHGLTPTDDPDVLWNFEKFLISRDGQVVGRFAPSTTPDDPALVAAIERQLQA